MQTTTEIKTVRMRKRTNRERVFSYKVPKFEGSNILHPYSANYRSEEEAKKWLREKGSFLLSQFGRKLVFVEHYVSDSSTVH